MSKQRRKRNNGGGVIDRIIPLLIPESPGDPNYRANYKRLRRHRARIERFEPDLFTQLEKDADRLLRDLDMVLSRKRVLKP